MKANKITGAVVAVMILSECFISAIAAEETLNAPIISLTSENVRCGREVVLNLSIENNDTGFANLSLEIDYDSDALELEYVEPYKNIEVYSESEYDDMPFAATWNSAKNVEYNGVLMKLHFTVSEDAAPGDYEVTVSHYKGLDGDYIDGTDVNYTDIYEPLGLVYKSGTITVTDHDPGDVNDDGVVDYNDATDLSEYIADHKNANVLASAADINGDSNIGNKDLILLLKYIAGWDVKIK